MGVATLNENDFIQVRVTISPIYMVLPPLNLILRQWMTLQWYRMKTSSNGPSLSLDATNIRQALVSPTKIDMYWHLNHANFLSIFEASRISFAGSTSIALAIQKKFNNSEDIGFVASNINVRYRRPLFPFDRIFVSTKSQGWDDKFFYIRQEMYKENPQENPTARSLTTCIVKHAMVGKESGETVAPQQIIEWALDIEKDNGWKVTPPSFIKTGKTLPEYVLKWNQVEKCLSDSPK